MPNFVAQRLSRVAAAVATCAVLAVGAVGPAAADDVPIDPYSSSQCAVSRFCLWSGVVYTGAIFSTTTSADVVGMTVAHAVWNRTSKAVRVHASTGGGGTSTCFPPGSQVASTTVQARSVVVLTTTTC